MEGGTVQSKTLFNPVLALWSWANCFASLLARAPAQIVQLPRGGRLQGPAPALPVFLSCLSSPGSEKSPLVPPTPQHGLTLSGAVQESHLAMQTAPVLTGDHPAHSCLSTSAPSLATARLLSHSLAYLLGRVFFTLCFHFLTEPSFVSPGNLASGLPSLNWT